ncbi:hypothetical protein RyT2_15860 [Pseudolactococcus yaeyamensis]
MSAVKRFFKTCLLLWLLAFLVLEVVILVHTPKSQVKSQGYWTAMTENTMRLLNTGSLTTVEKDVPQVEVIVE